MQGNEAVAWGAIAAGCRFFAGYPITPSTEIAEMLSRELPKVGGKFIQMEDEIASLAACLGASEGGVMQARWGTHGDHPIIVLSPASVGQAFDLTVTAFNFSEQYRTPVILLLDEVVGHMRERVELPEPGSVTCVERMGASEPPEW